jgi:hypothetical protein
MNLERHVKGRAIVQTSALGNDRSAKDGG